MMAGRSRTSIVSMCSAKYFCRSRSSSADQAVAPKKPWLLKYRSSSHFIVGVICFGIFTDIFLYGLIVPVIPFALKGRAGVDAAQVQRWVAILLAVYGAGILVSSPIFGWMADHTKSRRTPLLVGLLALLGSTLMLCLGRTLPVLVVGRLLQGMSAGMIWTVGLALLVDTVGENKLGEVMGWVSISLSSALLLGPLLGGIVYDHAGYYSTFAMAFALIAVDILLRFILVEKKVAAKWVDVDAAPVQESQKTDDPENVPVKVKGETEVNLTRPSKKSRAPPVIRLLKSPRTLVAMLGTIVQSILLTSFDSVLPLYANRKFGFTSTGSGLLFLAIVIPNGIGPFIGVITDRWGGKWLATGGFILVLPFYTLLRLVDHGGVQQIVVLCVFLFFIGLGVTITMPPVMAEFAADVDEQVRNHPGIFGSRSAYAQAYGLFNVAYAIGLMVGPIWAGFVEQRAGWGNMTWSLGLLSGLTAIPMAFVLGGVISVKRKRREASPAVEENDQGTEMATR